MTNEKIQHTIDCLQHVASEFEYTDIPPPTKEEKVHYDVILDLLRYFRHLLTCEDEVMSPEEAYERAMRVIK